MKIKYLIYPAILLLLASCKPEDLENEQKTEAGKYTIVYSTEVESEEGSAIAMGVRKAISAATGDKLKMDIESAGKDAFEILVGDTGEEASNLFYNAEYDDFDYKVFTSGNKIVVAGGGCWALEKAVAEIETALKSGKSISSISLEGNVYGEPLLAERTGDANVRIMDWNIWNNGLFTMPESWKPFWNDLGRDPTIPGREKNWAAVMFAYMPDIIGIQEYSTAMGTPSSNPQNKKFLLPLLEQKGYAVVTEYTNTTDWNWTPVLYNPAKFEVVEAEFIRLVGTVPGFSANFNDNGSKASSIVVFKHREEPQEYLILANSHLWWKSSNTSSENYVEGSDEARTAQVAEIKAKVDEYQERYPGPVVFMGDMNTTIKKPALEQLLREGYLPAWEAARLIGDAHHGRHRIDYNVCDRNATGTTAKNDGTTCIDHMLVDCGENMRVETFRRIMPRFAMYLADHYPNFMDILLTERKADLRISTSSITVEPTATSTTFDILSNAGWKIESDNDQFTFDQTAGTGNKTVTVSFPNYAGTTTHTANITVTQVAEEGGKAKSVALVITQAEPSLRVSANALSAGARDTEATFTITSNVEWELTGASVTAMTATSGTYNAETRKGSGNATIKVTFPENSDTANTVERTVTVSSDYMSSDEVVTITQAKSVPFLSVSTNAITIDYDATQTTFNIVSNTNWSISASPATVGLSETSGTGNATITVTSIPDNDTEANALVATITVTGTGVDDDSEVNITRKTGYVTETLVAANLGLTHNQAFEANSFDKSSFTLTFDKNGFNQPIYHNKGGLRPYAGETFTISSERTIVKIELDIYHSSSADIFKEASITLSAGGGNYADAVWTGEAESVSFTVNSTSTTKQEGQFRLSGLTVVTKPKAATPQP